MMGSRSSSCCGRSTICHAGKAACWLGHATCRVSTGGPPAGFSERVSRLKAGTTPTIPAARGIVAVATAVVCAALCSVCCTRASTLCAHACLHYDVLLHGEASGDAVLLEHLEGPKAEDCRLQAPHRDPACSSVTSAFAASQHTALQPGRTHLSAAQNTASQRQSARVRVMERMRGQHTPCWRRPVCLPL